MPSQKISQDPTVIPTGADIVPIVQGGSNANSTFASFPISTATQSAINGKQDTLVSGTNIKTVNSTSLLGSGDIVISGSVADGDKGDITVSGSGATWTIDNSVVTTTKLGGDITTAGKALLDDSDASAQRTTLGLGTLATQSGTFSGTSSGTNTGDQTITNTSDGTSHTATLSATGGSLKLVEGTNITLTTTGTGSDGIVTIASTSGGTGDVVGPASSTDNAIARFDATTGKLLQNSGVTIGDTNIISGVDTLNTVALNATGQVSFTNTSSAALIIDGGITFEGATNRRIDDGGSNELIKFPTTSIASAVNEFTISNAATGSGPILEATGGDTNIDLNLKTKGSGVLKINGVALVSGTGDVVGPASSTDNAIARFDATTGKLIQNSVATIADTSGDITAGKYNTVSISGSSTPTLAVTGTTAVSGTNTGDNATNTTYTTLATTLSTANTWSAVQTFLTGMFGLRNVANTFTSFFTNTNTASRTYTLKDASGTLAFTTDITGTNSGTNTGDQTITLTGAVTGSGTGSFATTIATPGTVTVSSTNSTATAHTHAITSSSAPGVAASLLATDASGHIGSTGTRIAKIWATDITTTNAIAGSITGNAATVTTNANLTGHITSTGNATVLGSFTMAQLDAAVNDGNVVYQSQALGTPASGTLTNCTGLPVAGITSSTSAAIGVGSIELGHASDTTLSRSSAGTLAVEGTRVRTTTPLVVSAASYTTDTGTSLNMDNLDDFIITAQAGALLFNSPLGTLVQGRILVIRIKDNGTARALTWNAVFRAMGTALPTTTVLSKTLYLLFKYNSTDTKWDLLASGQEA